MYPRIKLERTCYDMDSEELFSTFDCRILDRAVEAVGCDPLAGSLWEKYLQLETQNVRTQELYCIENDKV